MFYISLTPSNFLKILNLNSFVKDLNFLFCLLSTLIILNFSRLWFSVWNMSKSKLKGSFGGGVLLGFGGLSAFCIWSGMSVLGLYQSRNCSSYSLTLFRGMGFRLFHFPVLGGVIGF